MLNKVIRSPLVLPVGLLLLIGGCGPENDDSSPEQCSNGVDDDGDTLIDCQDSDCANDQACASFCNNNGICDAGEHNGNCPSDCQQAVCGNGACEATESATSCPQDCAQNPVCGNGTCESGKTASSCPADCGGQLNCTGFAATPTSWTLPALLEDDLLANFIRQPTPGTCH